MILWCHAVRVHDIACSRSETEHCSFVSEHCSFWPCVCMGMIVLLTRTCVCSGSGTGIKWLGSVTDWPQEFCYVMHVHAISDGWSEIGQVLRNLRLVKLSSLW